MEDRTKLMMERVWGIPSGLSKARKAALGSPQNLNPKNLPKDVIPITWKNGLTTYNYKGKEYDTLEEVPVPRSQLLDRAGEAIGSTLSKTPGINKVLPTLSKIGEATDLPGENAFAEQVGESFQRYGIDKRIGVGVGYFIYPGFGELKAVDKTLKGSMQLAPVVANTGSITRKASTELPSSAKPLQIASDLSPASWQGTIGTLLKDGSPQSIKRIRTIFENGYGGKLKKQYTNVKDGYWSIDKLVGTDEGRAVVERLVNRANKIDQLFTKYRGKLSRNSKSTGLVQREIYDVAAKNFNDASMLIYGQKGARKYLAGATRWLSKNEWHHIFGNKEAGEFLLSAVAQDPVVAVNLFRHMDKLGLTSSGIAKNIAVMKQGPHKELHRWMVKEGFQGGAADFGELGQALGKSIQEGTADVNDLFRMLELYADFNKHIRGKIKGGDFGKYGSDVQMLNEIPEGVGKALQMGGYRKKAPNPDDIYKLSRR